MHYLILGLGTPGLFILRQLSKTNNKVTCFCRESDIGFYSKYGNKIIAQDSAEIKNNLNKLEKDIKIIITSDYYLNIILNNKIDIFEKFNLIGPSKSTFRMFNSKKETNRIAKKNNIPYIKSYSYNTVNNVKDDLYPLILKWNIASTKTVEFKSIIINNKDELEKKLNEIDSSFYNNLIFQKYISGGNKNDYSYGGFFINGRPIVSIIVNQIRQYPVGVSSYVKEVTDKKIANEIENYVISIMNDVNYTGFAEIEFKYDPSSKKYLLLEINPRPWGWIKILTKKYPEFHQIFNLNFQQTNKSKIENYCSWANIPRDLYGTYKKENIIHLFKNLFNYYKDDIIFDILDLNDIKPFINIYKKF